MRYATAMGRTPHDTYRAVDIAGRTGAADAGQLIEVLYEEGVRALRSAAWAAEHGELPVRNERVSRATAILFALESGLDFDRGGEVSRTLATFYHGLRQRVIRSSLGNDPAPFRHAANDLEEIAGAWATVRGG